MTLMRGKEETNFIKAKDDYEKMQVEIASGVRFNYHDEESRRIVPKEIQPIIDKRFIDIPPENTQAELPEPTKRGRPPKRPPKKFHMPDNVRTGFTKVSRLYDNEDDDGSEQIIRKRKESFTRPPSPIPVPELNEVLLTAAEQTKLERHYLDIKGYSSQTVEVPRTDAFPELQRVLRATKHVSHSQTTKRFVKVMQGVATSSEQSWTLYEEMLDERTKIEGQTQANKRAGFITALQEGCFGNPSMTYKVPDASSSKLSQSERETVKSSSDREYEANDLDSLVDDRIDDALSSTSSPPPPLEHEEPLYRSQKIDDGDDLPDLSDLVRNERVTEGRASTRGRSGRNLVLEDSDDDI